MCFDNYQNHKVIRSCKVKPTLFVVELIRLQRKSNTIGGNWNRNYNCNPSKGMYREKQIVVGTGVPSASDNAADDTQLMLMLAVKAFWKLSFHG